MPKVFHQSLLVSGLVFAFLLSGKPVGAVNTSLLPAQFEQDIGSN